MARTPNDWDQQTTWKDIKEGARAEINKVRVSTKVFDKKTYAETEKSPPNVPNEKIDFENFSVVDGDAKKFVEIQAEFVLSQNQVEGEEDLHTAQTLATMVAKAIALAEDAYFFQSSGKERPDRKPPRFPSNVTIKNWDPTDPNKAKATDLGLLAEVPSNQHIQVPKSKSQQAIWGENTFKAVAAGIAQLEAQGQAGDYALFLPTGVYADTFAPPSPASLVTTADRIKPLVEKEGGMGFYSSAVLPEDEGLLVALGGVPIKLFIAPEVTVKYDRVNSDGYFFQVVERVQYVVRDPRAMMLLKFEKEKSANP